MTRLHLPWIALAVALAACPEAPVTDDDDAVADNDDAADDDDVADDAHRSWRFGE